MNYPESLTRNLTRYDITILQVPPSWNRIKGKHWAVEYKAKEPWCNELGWLAIEANIPKDLPHVYMEATVYYPSSRDIPDPNNCMVWKFTEDALQRVGIIANDTQEFVTTLQPTLLVDRENPRTEIVIWTRGATNE